MLFKKQFLSKLKALMFLESKKYVSKTVHSELNVLYSIDKGRVWLLMALDIERVDIVGPIRG